MVAEIKLSPRHDFATALRSGGAPGKQLGEILPQTEAMLRSS